MALRRFCISLAVLLMVVSVGCQVRRTPVLVTSTPVSTSTPEPTATLAIAQVLRGAAQSVVRVQSQAGEGTGFVAFEPGQVLTAYHVVRDADAVLTVVSSEEVQYRAMVLGIDEDMDIALLAVPNLACQPLPIARSVEVGETVYAIGFAAGLPGEASITQGIVSARREATDSFPAFLQTDASINPGNSGGPLLNGRGEVVGINVAKLRGEMAEFESMGFAIPVDEVRQIHAFLQAGGMRLLPTPTTTSLPSPRPSPRPTSSRVPTQAPSPDAEWCAFRVKVDQFLRADEQWFEDWNERASQGSLSVEERNIWANRYVDIARMACTLPMTPSAAKPVADALCVYADRWTMSLRTVDPILVEAFEANVIQLRTEAITMLSDLNTQFGSPDCAHIGAQ